jgi:hypothetical protein
VKALSSVQFVVAGDGERTGVFMEMADWEALLDWLEDLEDRALVQSSVGRLRMGPEKSGALRWDAVETEWSDGTA